MNWDIQYIHSAIAHDLAREIESLCGLNGYELVSVAYDGKRYHAFLKKPKKVVEE